MIKFKGIVIFLICCSVLFSGCSREQKLEDGVALEVYAGEADRYGLGDVYHVQGSTIVNAGGYMPCSYGGTPKYIRNRAGSHFDLDGHGMYEAGYGQLDDYYVDETTEIYLYTQSGAPSILYFKDGERCEVTATLGTSRQMQYMNGYIYLFNHYNKDGYRWTEVEKIDPETDNSEYLYYRFTGAEDAIQQGFFETRRLNNDESFFYRWRDWGGTDIERSRELLHLSYLDGSFYEIEATDPAKENIELVFETAEGYALLETPVYFSDPDKQQPFYLRLRYLDRQGRTLRQEEIDCSEMTARTNKVLRLESGAIYHDGTLYLCPYDGTYIYTYCYDIEKKALNYCGKIKGDFTYETRLVSIRNGTPYTLYGNGLNN